MRILRNRDFLTALVLFGIGAVFLSDGGDDLKDWVFPLLAAYLVLGIGVALLLLVGFKVIRQNLPDIVRVTPEDRIAYFDVLVFFLIVLVYTFMLYKLGFWLSSVLMLTATSVYLTLEKTRKNIGLALAVPLATCIVAYFVFTHVFYVPFPESVWWESLAGTE